MKLEKVKELCDSIIDTVSDYFVGESPILQKILSTGLANGHILFEDYPGLGKTLLAKTFAKATGCTWKRIQFTPDLMPSDIIGTKVWRINTSEFKLEKGPVFSNILLADEINRSPPKVQSALLECMEEKQVTIEGETHKLDPPFFVMATQNPIELEGTYPLPEAQMDRFLMKLSTGYVKSLEKEYLILKRRNNWQQDDPTELIESVATDEIFYEMQQFVEREIYIDDEILMYISDIVRKTREHQYVEVGSSPRGGLSLSKTSKALAVIRGRDFVTPDDVKFIVGDVLSHRLILKMEYELDMQTDTREIIDNIVEKIEPPIDVVRR